MNIILQRRQLPHGTLSFPSTLSSKVNQAFDYSLYNLQTPLLSTLIARKEPCCLYEILHFAFTRCVGEHRSTLTAPTTIENQTPFLWNGGLLTEGLIILIIQFC